MVARFAALGLSRKQYISLLDEIRNSLVVLSGFNHQTIRLPDQRIQLSFLVFLFSNIVIWVLHRLSVLPVLVHQSFQFYGLLRELLVETLDVSFLLTLEIMILLRIGSTDCLIKDLWSTVPCLTSRGLHTTGKAST